MGILDRIILTVYTFILTLLSLGVVLFGLRLIPSELIRTSLDLIEGRWEASLVGLVFFLVSIRLLLAGTRSKNNRSQTMIIHNSMGDVHIAIDAIENLVMKASRHAKGVRGVKAKASYQQDGLRVSVKAVISPDTHVPEVTAEMQQLIQESVKETLGIDLIHVNIVVENITNDFKAKHRVE